ncbi:MAG: ABC transporter permease [Treponema sp.]|nr:ABC transporter permease [Treponema sp.]
MNTYLSNKKFVAGSVIVFSFFAVTLIGLFVLPYDPLAIDIPHKLSFFSSVHWLGTDGLGRDMLSRILYGNRISFFIGLGSSFIGFFIGCFIGAIGGWYGGILDECVSKVIDILMAFPGILLALVFVSLCGSSLLSTVCALGIMSIPRFARISRGAFMEYRHSYMVMASQARGASVWRIIFVHIIPNITSELIVTFTLTFAYAVMSEAGLSYLGLGVQPPLPSFGRMLNEGQGYIFTAPWVILIPCLFLSLPIIGLTLISDSITAIRDARKR